MSFNQGFEKIAYNPKRSGTPRTDKERAEQHKKQRGDRKLPPRGTGRILAMIGKK